jgi:hypothetical protein
MLMNIKLRSKAKMGSALDIRHFMIVRKNRRTEVQKYKKAKVRQSLEFGVRSQDRNSAKRITPLSCEVYHH